MVTEWHWHSEIVLWFEEIDSERNTSVLCFGVADGKCTKTSLSLHLEGRCPKRKEPSLGAGSGSDLLSDRELAVGLGSGSSPVAFCTHPLRMGSR